MFVKIGNRMLKYLYNKVYILFLKIIYLRVVRINKNEIQIRGIIRKIKFDIKGHNNQIFFAKNSLVKNTTIYIRGSNHTLHIEENCKYNGGELWFEDNNCQIHIFSDTTVESAHIAVTEPNSKIIIGKDCMLAKDVVVRSGDSHSIIDNKSLKRLNFAKNVIINEHVWIASRSCILKGVTIGKNSVVGSGSIVTKDVPENSIVVGNAGKIVKSNINWTRERLY